MSALKQTATGKPQMSEDRLQRRDDLLRYGGALAETLRQRIDQPSSDEALTKPRPIPPAQRKAAHI